MNGFRREDDEEEGIWAGGSGDFRGEGRVALGSMPESVGHQSGGPVLDLRLVKRNL